MKYVGLTDDPETRKAEHGKPPDWWQRRFLTEAEARQWEQDLIAKPGHKGRPGGAGWTYGYTYTITSTTRE